MIWTEGIIVRAVARQTLASKCVVLVDRCVWTGYECDVLAVISVEGRKRIGEANKRRSARKDAP